MTRPGPLADLLRLSRVVTEPAGRAGMLSNVAELAAAHVGADAALVVLVDGEHARVAATKGCDDSSYDWRLDADALGAELEDAILARCRAENRGYTFARSAPMISDGALFGAIVVLYATDEKIGDEATSLLAGIADIAAASLFSAQQFERLERANAELRASRSVLEKTEKLRVLGEMAAGVSHDLKNILNPLGLFLQLAMRQLRSGDNSAVEQSLDEMCSVVNRGAELLESLRQFSRQTPDAAEQMVELDALAHEALAIARPRMSSSPGRKALPFVVEELGAPPRSSHEAARSCLPSSICSRTRRTRWPAAAPSPCGPERTGAARSSRWPTTAVACRPRSAIECSSRSSPRRVTKAPGSGSRWCTPRWCATEERPRYTARRAMVRGCGSGFRIARRQTE